MDAGTVRTGILEAMAEAGEIDMGDIRVLAKKEHPDFPYLVSTSLYPEWALARLSSIDKDLADAVAFSLKNMTETDRAAVDDGCTGWSDPLDYSGEQRLQKELKVGAYEEEN